jgi:hypothetical protein
LELQINVTPSDAQLISAECRRRLAASLFKNKAEMQTLGYDIGSMSDSALSDKRAGSLESSRRKRVSLLNHENAEELCRLDSLYSIEYLAGLSLLNASKLENQRRKRVSLLNHENAEELCRLDSLYSIEYLAGLSLLNASKLEMQRRKRVSLLNHEKRFRD